MQVNKDDAERGMSDWVKQARKSKVPQLVKMAATVTAHRTGILACYDCHISTGKVERHQQQDKGHEENGIWI